jgi:hypothetical protein
MSNRKIMMPPNKITTRLDGFIGYPGQMPASIAKAIADAAPKPSRRTIAAIRARMFARHKKVFCND